MADDSITPGASPANIPYSQSSSDDAWQAALDRYHVAVDRRLEHRATRLHPAYDGKRAFAKVSAIEIEADRLWEVQIERLNELVAIPAPDDRALLAKLEYSYRDYLIFELSSREVVAHMISDLRRLHGAP